MGKRARQQRGEARVSEPPVASADNVIQLPVARAEPAEAEPSQSAAHGKRKKGRGKHKRGATKHEAARPGATAPSDPPVASESEPPSALESEPPTASEHDGTDMLDETEGEGNRAAVQRFFSEPPAAPASWDGAADEASSEENGARRARRWAASTLVVVGALSIGSFLVYSKLLTPAPEPSRAAAEAAPATDVLEALARAPETPIDAPPAEPTRAEGEAHEPASERPNTEVDAPSTPPEPSPAEPIEGAQVEAEDPSRARAGAAIEAPERTPTASDQAGYGALLARARKQGLRRAAESTYLQALAIRPDGAEALSGLAMLYLNQGKNAAARDRAREAIRADDTSSEAWIVLGAALSSLGDAQGAREAYMRCAGLSSGKYVNECRRMVR